MKMMKKIAAAVLVAAMAVTFVAPMTARAEETRAEARARLAAEKAAAVAHEMGDIAHGLEVAFKEGRTGVIDVTGIKDYAWASNKVWKAAVDENGLTKADIKVVYVVKRTVKTYVIPGGSDSALFKDSTNHIGGFDFIAAQLGITPQ